jgi:hypothetical protein
MPFRKIDNAINLRPNRTPFRSPGFLNKIVAPLKETTQIEDNGVVWDDLERLYMKVEPKNNVLFRSQYIPKDRTENHADFVSISDSLFEGSVIDQAEIIKAFQNNPDSIKQDHLRKYEAERNRIGYMSQKDDQELLSDFAPPQETEKGNWRISRRSPTPHMTQNPLGSYTIGFGNDQRGNYLSYADEFGANKQNSKWFYKPAERIGITKSFDVYGRIYEDENPRIAPLFKQQQTQ